MTRAIVIFESSDSPRLARWFKPGFSHVSIAIHVTDTLWNHLDWKWGRLTPTLLDVSADKITEFVATQPQAVSIETVIDTQAEVPSFPIWPFNCVAMVKSALGIHAPLVRTPYQLYRYLSRSR